MNYDIPYAANKIWKLFFVESNQKQWPSALLWSSVPDGTTWNFFRRVIELGNLSNFAFFTFALTYITFQENLTFFEQAALAYISTPI